MGQRYGRKGVYSGHRVNSWFLQGAAKWEKICQFKASQLSLSGVIEACLGFWS